MYGDGYTDVADGAAHIAPPDPWGSLKYTVMPTIAGIMTFMISVPLLSAMGYPVRTYVILAAPYLLLNLVATLVDAGGTLDLLMPFGSTVLYIIAMFCWCFASHEFRTWYTA